MALEAYRAKRRFGVTAEPRGKKARTQGRAFVIQKHAATRLHYDLRLELDGVMKSWAVTRGPSLVPGDKRLSIHVEDHPIEYNAFEGTIPKGEYGGGTVMVWDRGEWIPEGDPHAGYKKGHLDFRLEGEKLQGAWHLVRMRKRDGERQDPWLLIKSEDEAARSKKDPDILEQKPKSAASGRTMEQIAAGKGGKAVWSSARKKQIASPPAKPARPARQPKARTAAKRTRAVAKKSPRASAGEDSDLEGRRAALPDFVPPCLALLSAKAPDGDNWLHEIKFDGYRMQAHIDAGKVQLNTRNGLDWTERFHPVAEAFKVLPVENAIIDGEIVIETAEGLSSFSALQEALKKGKGDFVFYAFDLLYLNGKDVRRAPLAARKEELESLLADGPKGEALKFSENFEADGSVLLAHACRLNLEGVISKRRDAPYRSGRGGDWIKTKCGERQEFVIIGFAPATNDARAVGALVVGYYEGKVLKYAGRVGTGYSVKAARELWKKLRPLHADKVPLDKIPVEERGRVPQWVKPKLVAEVDFRGWTHGMRLRHPSFKGLREDKSATEVVRESKDMPTAATTSKPPVAKKGRSRKSVPSRAASKVKRNEAVDSAVGLTHPDRVYWEDAGLTKQGLADYYTQAWDWIAPHITGRVLSLLRCPDGAEGKCFFQKHASGGLDSKHLRLVPEDSDKVIAIDDLDGLIALVQAGVLEVHVRGSRIDRLDAADRLVFDLDPGPDVGWAEVKQAARAVRERLDALGLASFLKTTGGKGLHVVVPVDDAPWDAVKAFAKSFAFGMAKDSPERYVAVAAKAARTGRIFIDYMRNSREATAICAYSTRARPGATVSVPIAWSELSGLATPNRYTVDNVMGRLAKLKADPWVDIGRAKQKLPAAGRK